MRRPIGFSELEMIELAEKAEQLDSFLSDEVARTGLTGQVRQLVLPAAASFVSMGMVLAADPIVVEGCSKSLCWMPSGT